MIKGTDGYWGLLNPALGWLSFLPPFLAFMAGYRLAPLWGVVAVAAAVYLLFRQPDRPFRLWFYFGPLLALFLSYVFSPQYAFMLLVATDIWMNFAVFLPKGANEDRIYESLFSSKLLGIGLIAYIFILVAFDLKWFGSPIYLGWIPSVLLVLVYVVQTLRYYVAPAPREIKVLLPIARVAVVQGEKLLVKTDAEGIADLPFSFPITPGEVPFEVVEKQMRNITDQEPKFLLKYRQETKAGERVVYLFVINLKHGEAFDHQSCSDNRCGFIDASQKKSIQFNTALKEEYDYLSSTIFMTNRMLSRL